ncbi:MAG TPA: CopD family protein [Rubrivivax sp.]|nr:CopD family protein [Rhodoferax sp.]MCL4738725.1 CopD family protein [Burkholderiaceae bacterium]MCP5289894.1 CopD family protein [Burkholderiaceae bacterium]HMQ72081.1 CopD family protein [Rubrivivax sp.]HMR70933.1 CopD family protein [Rubrivivax sp.]
MTYALVKLVHLAAVIVWVGGMVFAHFFLRPALAKLEPPQRLALMHEVLRRFFGAVLVAVIAVLASGFWMIGDMHQRVAATGGALVMPWSWWAMTALGIVMAVVFAHIRFVLFPRMGQALAQRRLPDAAAALASIRGWVVVNLVIGSAIVVAVVVAV